MNVRLQLRRSSLLTRPALARRRNSAPTFAASSFRDEERAREAGGPVDRALYACSCGYAFNADVTASVSCPHCGSEQAW